MSHEKGGRQMFLRGSRGEAPTVTPSTLADAHVLAREFRHRSTIGSRWTHRHSSRESQNPLRTRASVRAKDNVEGVKEKRGDLQKSQSGLTVYRLTELRSRKSSFSRARFVFSRCFFVFIHRQPRYDINYSDINYE